MDLLLDLIRRQQIDIYDIPIARITAQYLEYLEQAAALDVELGAEFIFMAATLIHIKSRMLLPRDPELDKIVPEEDPRQELVAKLLAVGLVAGIALVIRGGARGFLIVLAANAVVLGSGLYLKRAEKAAQSLPVTGDDLAARYRRATEVWRKKPLRARSVPRSRRPPPALGSP